MLTDSAVKKLRPRKVRREVPDAHGLHLVIQPSGAKSWAVRYRRPDGRPVKLTLGTVDVTGAELRGEPVIGGHLTLTAARKLTSEVQRQRALGNDPVADKKAEKLHRRHHILDSGEATFPNAVKFYIAEGRRKRVRKGVLKNRGWRDTAQILGLRYPEDGGEPEIIVGGLCERWASKPIAEVTAEDVEVVVEEARERGIPGRPRRNKAASDVRKREMAGTLRAMFNWLLSKKRTTASGKRSPWIASNPAVGVDKPDAPLARDRVLNTDPNKRKADELRWFWKATEKLGNPFTAMLKTMLLTGQRRSEVADMTIEELSDDLSKWTIPASRTKNGREHTVPLPMMVCEILGGVIGDKTSGYVFTTTGKTPVSGFSKLKRKLDERMLAAAHEGDPKATIPPWRLHDLRRTFITGANEIGVEPHIVEAVVNHSLQGIAAVYNKATYAPQRLAALERWCQHVQAVVRGKPDQKVLPMKRRKAS
ncbi:MAG: tyrosine-type recombinase/integrase [Methyloceanibacter sp.]|uniref:tyrosine-type recombinase/integrase n=1 Tax=Methyloceanibacter sp. TaxID=1965321 RepID=UPI003D9BE53E